MALDTTKMQVTRTKDFSWRFVDHGRKLLTQGFRSHQKLMEYKDSFTDSEGSRKIMQERYQTHYGVKPASENNMTELSKQTVDFLRAVMIVKELD